jgi:hypothetical protein
MAYVPSILKTAEMKPHGSMEFQTGIIENWYFIFTNLARPGSGYRLMKHSCKGDIDNQAIIKYCN